MDSKADVSTISDATGDRHSGLFEIKRLSDLEAGETAPSDTSHADRISEEQLPTATSDSTSAASVGARRYARQAHVQKADAILQHAIAVWLQRLHLAKQRSGRRNFVERSMIVCMVGLAGAVAGPDLVNEAVIKALVAITSIGSILSAVLLVMDPYEADKMYCTRLERMIALVQGFRHQLLMEPTESQLKSISQLITFSHELLRPDKRDL